MSSLGLKLNVSKTIESKDIITDSIKPEKMYYITHFEELYKNDRKEKVIGIAITTLILILLIILTNIENSNLSYIENLGSKIVNPIQNGLTHYI